MVSREEYRSIQAAILSLLEDDSAIEPPELLARLSSDYGIPEGLGSTVMWEMIRAGYIGRSEDWRLTRIKDLAPEAEAIA